ncbi:MAG TPA: ribbon-helix-helix protein, CopG family [Candidatus Obscuribacterales bacterium]
MTRKVLIALPEPMLNQADMVAGIECRSRSDLMREALRRYLDNFSRSRGGIADDIQAIPSAGMVSGRERPHLTPIAR